MCRLSSEYIIYLKSFTLSLSLSQTLKLQEAPDAVPNGELPRHLQLYCDRYLTECVVPGNRVTVIGIYSIRKSIIKSSMKVLLVVMITGSNVMLVDDTREG